MNEPSVEAVLTSELPRERLGSEEDRARFSVEGITPAAVVFPESIPELQAAVRAAAYARLGIVPAGCAAHLGIGMPPQRFDCTISTARLDRVVEHAAADMTVTAQAGVTLGQLNTALAAAGQWLPLDPPLPEYTTIGGLIAANLTGPLRLSQGGVRDLLLGLRAVRADGTLIASGGRVVKNTAGYELHRAFIGCYGTLGVVVEATFKTRPRPETQAALVMRCDSSHQALQLVQAVRNTPMEPLWIAVASEGVMPERLGIEQAVAGSRSILAIGIGGIAGSVAAQCRSITALAGSSQGAGAPAVIGPRPESTNAAEGTYESVHAAFRDFPAQVAADAVCTIALLPSDLPWFISQLAGVTGRGQVEARFVADAAVARLHLALSTAAGGKDLDGLMGVITDLRRLATERKGHLVILRAPAQVKKSVGVWGESGPGTFLMERLKFAFDPEGLLSAGRFVGSL